MSGKYRKELNRGDCMVFMRLGKVLWRRWVFEIEFGERGFK